MTPKERLLEYFKDVNFVYNDCLRYDTLKIMIDNILPNWTPVSEGLPEENGKYLCTCRNAVGVTIEVVKFAKDLYKIDKYDFEDKKNKSGFYCYGEWGYYDMTQDIIAWMPSPEPYKEE